MLNQFLSLKIDLYQEECFFDLDAPIMRLTPLEIPPMPFSPVQESEYLPSKQKITSAISKLASI